MGGGERERREIGVVETKRERGCDGRRRSGKDVYGYWEVSLLFWGR